MKKKLGGEKKEQKNKRKEKIHINWSLVKQNISNDRCNKKY